MKTNRKTIKINRQIVDDQLLQFLALRDAHMPLSGWLKVVRYSLGLTANQLARRMNTQASNVLHLEKRETSKSATLSALDRAAKAMNCRLVWSIVPERPYDSLSAIVDKRARLMADKIIQTVNHTMKLEGQELPPELVKQQADDMALDLIRAGDSKIWGDLGEEIT